MKKNRVSNFTTWVLFRESTTEVTLVTLFQKQWLFFKDNDLAKERPSPWSKYCRVRPSTSVETMVASCILMSGVSNVTPRHCIGGSRALGAAISFIFILFSANILPNNRFSSRFSSWIRHCTVSHSVSGFVLMAHTSLGLDGYTDGEYWRTYSGLTEVPGDIPGEARKVFLFNNPITAVSPGAFSHLCQCTYLSLWGCELTVLDPGTVHPETIYSTPAQRSVEKR